MPDTPKQQLIPFPEETVETTTPILPSAGYRPSDEAAAAYDRLEAWLTGPRGPVTELAEETLQAVARALLEGKNGYFHKAEDGLETLKLRNGKTDGEDIPAGIAAEQGDDFQADVEAVLDALHGQMLARGRVR